MQSLIVQPKDRKQMAAATAALKALGIPFKKEKVEQYDPEFVKKIQKSIEEANAGKTTRIKPSDIWNLG